MSEQPNQTNDEDTRASEQAEKAETQTPADPVSDRDTEGSE